MQELAEVIKLRSVLDNSIDCGVKGKCIIVVPVSFVSEMFWRERELMEKSVERCKYEVALRRLCLLSVSRGWKLGSARCFPERPRAFLPL